ncbi:MAG: hypothetical protein F6K19_42580 [Cyanothece sp. SIO1E1]|nr:hypothetical protein [Cyanothece sp. SIO1E1]
MGSKLQQLLFASRQKRGSLLSDAKSNLPSSSMPSSVMKSEVPSAIEWSVFAVVFVVCVGWLGPRLWKFFTEKEEKESALFQAAFSDMRETQSQVLRDFQSSHKLLFQELQNSRAQFLYQVRIKNHNIEKAM